MEKVVRGFGIDYLVSHVGWEMLWWQGGGLNMHRIVARKRGALLGLMI